MLSKIKNIQKQYKGKSLLRTYIAVIIKNICNEILRDRRKSKTIFSENYVEIEGSYEYIDQVILEEEMIRLKKIVELFYRKKYRLILCLKLKFKMAIELEDFQRVNKNIKQVEFDKFMGAVHPYTECFDSKIFMALTSVLNKYENKDNTPDSLRKWVTDKMNELINLLNSSPPSSKYDKETFQILFERCYYKELKIEKLIG